MNAPAPTPALTITPRVRYRMSDLRALPQREGDRLEVLGYHLTPATSNGSRTYSYAPLLLAGQFGFEAQITRDGDGFWLELPLLADDRLRRRAVLMDYPPALLATLWHRLERRHVRARALAHWRGAGRN